MRALLILLLLAPGCEPQRDPETATTIVRLLLAEVTPTKGGAPWDVSSDPSQALPDLFAEVRGGKLVEHTAIIRDTLLAPWNLRLASMPIEGLATLSLTITVSDADPALGSDLAGTCELALTAAKIDGIVRVDNCGLHVQRLVLDNPDRPCNASNCDSACVGDSCKRGSGR